MSTSNTTSPPISPPIDETSRAAPPNPSIITTTSASGSRSIHLDTTAPAINATPVEIDGTPTSPAEQAAKRAIAWQSTGRKASFSPDHLVEEEKVLEEFGLDGGKGIGKEKRAALLQERKSDPAVLVDIPQGPSGEEFAAANAVEPDQGEPVKDR